MGKNTIMASQMHSSINATIKAKTTKNRIDRILKESEVTVEEWLQHNPSREELDQNLRKWETDLQREIGALDPDNQLKRSTSSINSLLSKLSKLSSLIKQNRISGSLSGLLTQLSKSINNARSDLNDRAILFEDTNPLQGSFLVEEKGSTVKPRVAQTKIPTPKRQLHRTAFSDDKKLGLNASNLRINEDYISKELDSRENERLSKESNKKKLAAATRAAINYIDDEIEAVSGINERVVAIISDLNDISSEKTAIVNILKKYNSIIGTRNPKDFMELANEIIKLTASIAKQYQNILGNYEAFIDESKLFDESILSDTNFYKLFEDFIDTLNNIASIKINKSEILSNTLADSINNITYDIFILNDYYEYLEYRIKDDIYNRFINMGEDISSKIAAYNRALEIIKNDNQQFYHLLYETSGSNNYSKNDIITVVNNMVYANLLK